MGQSITLKGTENKSKTIVDDNGYYYLPFGALNTYNIHGEYYRVKDLSKIAGNRSLIGNRLKAGLLKGEKGHPVREPSMSDTAFINRNIEMNGDRVCGHIKAINFDVTNNYEPGFNLPIIKVRGWIRPIGPFGEEFKESLENPDMNTAMSIRSIVSPIVVGSVRIKDVLQISTYDYVTENGVHKSTQWDNSVSSESLDLDITKITEDEMREILVSAESGTTQDVEDILRQLYRDDTNLLFDW